MADARSPTRLGRYELLYLLGQGGMGEVHLAKLTGAAGFEKLCIVKTILPQLNADPQFIDRFHHEAKTLVALNHSNIAQVYDMGEVDQTLYMAIEYIAGVDLARTEDRVRALGSRFPIPIALKIGEEICEALGYAHRKQGPDGASLGIVHRDVSPHNVMVSYEGEVKVIDFGLAKSTARSKATLPSTVLGKLGYMSPEQARGQVLDHRSDTYSAGIVIWEMLAGQPAFAAGTVGEMVAHMAFPNIPRIRELRPEVSERLEAIVMRALAPEPGSRYDRCDDFANALKEVAVRENMQVRAEDVGNYVKRSCPQEFAAESQLQARLSHERVKSGRTPIPHPATGQETALRVEGNRALTPAQKAISQVDPAAAGPTEEPLVVRRSRAPFIGAGLFAVAAIGAGAWLVLRGDGAAAEKVVTAPRDPPPLEPPPKLNPPEPLKREEPTPPKPAARELVEVKGDVFKVLRKDSDVFVRISNGKPKLAYADVIRLVGPPGEGNKRELYGEATVLRVDKGTLAPLLVEDASTLPEKDLFGTVVSKPKVAVAAPAVDAGQPAKTGLFARQLEKAALDAGRPPEPRVEAVTTPPIAAPPMVEANAAPVPAAGQRLVGKMRLNGSGETASWTVINESTFDWHNCRLRFPFAGRYHAPEILAGHELQIAWGALQKDRAAPLPHKEYGAAYCTEGSASLPYERVK